MTPSGKTVEPLDSKSLAIVLLTAALWGGTPVAVSFAASSLPPVAIAAVRFALGALFMLAWCWLGRTPMRLQPGQFRLCLVAGLLLAVQIVTFNVAIEWSNASHSSVLISTFVFWVIAIEHFITKTDRLTTRKAMGLVVAFIGVLVMLSKAEKVSASVPVQDDPSLAGDLVMVFSAFLLAVRVVYVKQVLPRIEPGKLILWHDLVGVVCFLSFSFAFEEFTRQALTVAAVLGLLYQGLLVAGLCFALQTQLLKKHSASQLSMFSFSTPVFGVLLAAVFRDDPLSSWLFISGACIALGIYIVNSQPQQKTA